MSRTPTHTPLLFALLAAVAGCSGNIDGRSADNSGASAGGIGGAGAGDPPAGSAGPRSGSPGGAAGSGGASADADKIGPLPVLRLTHDEYNNSIAALLGDTTDYAGTFTPEALNNVGFKAGATVATLDARKYMETAQSIAEKAVKNLSTLVACDTKVKGEAPCARTFVETFGRRAYRRPLSTSEVSELLAVYDQARSQDLDFATGIQLVLEAILQSPKFLYRWEVVPGTKPMFDQGAVRLTTHQVASRLSYLVWGGPPDEALLGAADAGALSTSEQILTQTKRLLTNTERAGAAMSSFQRQWLHFDDKGGIEAIQKSASAFPSFDDDMRLGLKGSFNAFAAALYLEGDVEHTLKGLFTSRTGFVNEKIAPLFGVKDVKGAALSRRELDGTQRAGVFTQPPFLAVHSPDNGTIPTKRGMVIWRDVLCGPLGAVPAMVPEVEASTPNTTTRARFEKHDKAPCAVCHKFLDPIGFALENYDAVGQYRTKEGTATIDASGSFDLPGGKTIAFKNALELMDKLAETDDARDCAVTQWFRYALGREEVPADVVAIRGASAAVTRKGGDLREILTAIVTSRSFSFRAPEQGEMP